MAVHMFPPFRRVRRGVIRLVRLWPKKIKPHIKRYESYLRDVPQFSPPNDNPIKGSSGVGLAVFLEKKRKGARTADCFARLPAPIAFRVSCRECGSGAVVRCGEASSRSEWNRGHFLIRYGRPAATECAGQSSSSCAFW